MGGAEGFCVRVDEQRHCNGGRLGRVKSGLADWHAIRRENPGHNPRRRFVPGPFFFPALPGQVTLTAAKKNHSAIISFAVWDRFILIFYDHYISHIHTEGKKMQLTAHSVTMSPDIFQTQQKQ